MIIGEGSTADGAPVQFVALTAGQLQIRTADDEGRTDVDLELDDPWTLAELTRVAAGSLEALSRSLVERRRVDPGVVIPETLTALIDSAREQLARAVTNLSQL